MYVCLFDIDGTLLNSGGAGKAALETALQEEFGVAAIKERISYSGRTDRSIMRDLLRTNEIEDTPANMERLIAGYLQRLPDSLTRNQGYVLPGIFALLEGLTRREEVSVGLLTGNIRVGAKVKLGYFGLFEFFAFGGFGDLHWERDDVAREALSAVREHVGEHIHLHNIWVIGDTPLDVRCARAIGVKVAAVATGWHPVEELAPLQPDLLLQDLSDPEPILTHWK